MPRNILISTLAALLSISTPMTSAQSDIPISSPLQEILAKAGSGNYTYPTSFTQGIIPKNFHSHNDYWRPVPFYSALSVGAMSVEADVWLYNETLYVGHETAALTQDRTFDSLYIQPILNVLTKQNPNTTFTGSVASKNGVYDTSSGQTLYLFVDVKTDGPTTWPYVIKALQPLRSAGYLSTVNGTSVSNGPVTVIGTGNTPLNQVQGVSPRDFFWDAQIPQLNSTQNNITASVSPIASTSFSSQFGSVRGAMNETQTALLKSQIATAKAKGIKTRYWDQPGWPVNTRNEIWKTLWEAGVDLLNVDDLEGAANFWEGQN